MADLMKLHEQIFTLVNGLHKMMFQEEFFDTFFPFVAKNGCLKSDRFTMLPCHPRIVVGFFVSKKFLVGI